MKGSILSDRVGHAYIFLGPKGIGKHLTAVNFAKALNCRDVKEGEPCDACISCRKVDGSNHPDVLVSRIEDDASSIKIDAIRGIIKDINLKPYEGRKKVYIVDEADSMKYQATSALLKTLEEPPSDSIIILLAENLGMLFQTIVSRCQVVRFFPLGIDEVKEILVRQHSVEEPRARILSHLSGGKLGEALEYKEQDIFDTREGLIKGLMKRSLFDIDMDKITREEAKVFLDIMLTWYRDILAVKVGATVDMLINADKIDVIKSEAAILGIEYIDRVIEQIMLTGLYLDHSANMKLAMGVLASRVQYK